MPVPQKYILRSDKEVASVVLHDRIEKTSGNLSSPYPVVRTITLNPQEMDTKIFSALRIKVLYNRTINATHGHKLDYNGVTVPQSFTDNILSMTTTDYTFPEFNIDPKTIATLQIRLDGSGTWEILRVLITTTLIRWRR